MAEGNSWHSFCSLLASNHLDREKFNKIPHEKKVYECYSDEEIKNALLLWILMNQSADKQSSKSPDKSKELRNFGNEKYAKADVLGSLELYTASVICAPHGSRELFLALGNRSAAALRLHHYKACIADIEFATENYSDNTILPKLLARKQEALHKLKKSKESEKETCTSETDQLNKDINGENGAPVVCRGLNECFPFASSLVKLESDSKGCRRVVANDDIEAGDILLVENPYSFILKPEYFKKRCQFCCKNLRCPIACPGCNDILFCDGTCFKYGYNSYHKWECSGSFLLYGTGVGIIALRTLLKASHDPFSLHYEQVNSLQTHINDIQVDDMMCYCLTAAMLTLYLEKFTDYFSQFGVQQSVDGVGFRLLKHMLHNMCNGFAMKTSSFGEAPEYESLERCYQKSGAGLYPSTAMMNHSCDPNIVISFYHSSLVVRASNRISKGEEVLNCYGPHYRRQNTEERKQKLKHQYYFDCACKKCIVPEKITNFLCLICKSQCVYESPIETELKCPSCGTVEKRGVYDELIEKAEVIKQSGYECMHKEKYAESLTIFEKLYQFLLSFMDIRDSEIEKCSLEITNCHQAMTSWLDIPERARLIKLCDGEFSPEYGEFLRSSLSSYLTYSIMKMPSRNRLSSSDLSKYVNELLKIVEYNFGRWSLEYKYVRRLKNSLLELRHISS